MPLPENCPLEKALRLVADGWVLLIIRSLMQGSKRFCELERDLPQINTRTLTERLKRLQNEGLIEHQKQEKILVKNGAYQITAKGQDLEKIISAIEQYGNKYFNHIVD